VEKLGAKSEGPALFGLVADVKVSAKVRNRALEILAAFGDPQLGNAVEHALADKDAKLRVTALTLLGKLDPDEAATKLAVAFKDATGSVKKVILTSLGALKSAGADRALAGLIDDLIAGKVPAEIQLELLEAAGKRESAEVKAKLAAYEASLRKDDPIAAFRPTLAGGDKAAGEKLFKEHAVAQCLRCHKVNGQGGDAGPDLTGIAAKKNREYVLESIIVPNAKIAESFQVMLFTMKDGGLHAGLIKGENNDEVVVQAPGLDAVKLKKSEIASREMAPSGMPPGMDQLLTKREIRDLVEYVASLK
jgi:quinoprotein glucose dehydrogenase